MDPETAMVTAQEGAKAATKLGELLEKQFGPRLTKRQADADAYAIQKKIETIRDNPDMEIQYDGNKVHIRELTTEEIVERAKQRQLANMIREQRNIDAVINAARDDLQADDQIIDKNVDDDWITRFFNIVKDVSSEEMQFIWSKILSGEVKKPGSFSLRTLDTIRNLSKDDAESFEKLFPLVVLGDRMLFTTSDNELLQKYGVSFSDILTLEECGLIFSSDLFSVYTFQEGEKKHSIGTDTKIIIFEAEDGAHPELTFGITKLTSAGSELFRTLEHPTNDSFILDFAKVIRKENEREKVALSVHTVKEKLEDGNYICEKTPELYIP